MQNDDSEDCFHIHLPKVESFFLLNLDPSLRRVYTGRICDIISSSEVDPGSAPSLHKSDVGN